MNDIAIRINVLITCNELGNDNGPPCSSPAYTAPASLLPTPMTDFVCSGDPGAMVAVLVARSGQAQRAVQDQIRRSENATQEASENSQVERMHEAASDLRCGAIVSGLSTIASGAASAGSACSSGPAAKAMTVESEILGGTGKAGAGLFEAEAADARAHATESEHQAARAARSVKNADDGVDDANRLVEKALAFLKEYLTTRNQTLLAAAHRA